MDPLSALSLGGTVVQFVEFTAGLLGSAREIYRSASGRSSESDALEVIYQRLFDLNQDLEVQIPRLQSQTIDGEYGPRMLKRGNALRSLAAKCKADCERLLGIVGKLKAKSSSCREFWTSFVVAIKEVAKTKEVKELQERIAGYQRQMVLELCSASSQAVDDISLRIHELQAATQDIHSQRSRDLDDIFTGLGQIRSQIAALQSNASTKSVSADEFDALAGKISELSLTGQRYGKEHSLLSDLNYSHRPLRHENIRNAHEATFQWVLNPESHEQRVRTRIGRWLTTGQGVFWVSGKPGSGKSTLMKFIADHPQTRRNLSSWAGGKDVVLASHYFWYAGTSIQRSQEGLLRSLLFDILCQLPDLIPVACTERWLRSTGVKGAFFDSAMPWTLAELQAAMSRIAAKKDLPAKFCFFIDGLDEFNGDHSDICQVLVGLCTSPAFKMCISSRPWNVFEENLGDNEAQKLYIHELTGKDIQRYVEAQLHAHPRWNNLVSQTAGAASLVDEITNRAQGVFLWVYLVTRLLREGLTNYDTINDLRKRLEMIPSDLERFFTHMIESVEPFYHEKMAETLLIAVAAHEPLPTAIYAFHDLEYEDASYAINARVGPWDHERFERFKEPYSRRLSSRCKGLLEINGDTVEFLHRTVSDYLRMGEANASIAAKTRKNFNAPSSIFQAFVAFIKHIQLLDHAKQDPGSSTQPALQHLTDLLDTALSYARHPTLDGPLKATISREDLLDNLELAVQEVRDSLVSPHGGESGANLDFVLCREPTVLFRECALRAGLDEYVRRKLDQDTAYLKGFQIPPLAYLLGHGAKAGGPAEPDSVETWFPKRLELLHCLLTEGHDLNVRYTFALGDHTPWSQFAVRIIPVLKLVEMERDSGTSERPADTPFKGKRVRTVQADSQLTEGLRQGLFDMLLEFGADPNANLRYMQDEDGDRTSPLWAQFLFLPFTAPRISDHAKHYIRALDTMLSKANFKTPSHSLRHLTRELIDESGSQTETPAFWILEAEQSRTSVLKILWILLERISKDTAQSRMMSSFCREYQLVAKAITLFLMRAEGGSFPGHVLWDKLSKTFPLSLLGPLDPHWVRDEHFLQQPATLKRPRDQIEDEHERAALGEPARRRFARASSSLKGKLELGEAAVLDAVRQQSDAYAE